MVALLCNIKTNYPLEHETTMNWTIQCLSHDALNISFWSKLITTISLETWLDMAVIQVNTTFLFDSQGITFAALSYIEVLGYGTWSAIKNSELTEQWANSEFPPNLLLQISQFLELFVTNNELQEKKEQYIDRTAWTISFCVVVQFYPSFFIFLSHYHALTFPKTKKNENKT